MPRISKTLEDKLLAKPRTTGRASFFRLSPMSTHSKPERMYTASAAAAREKRMKDALAVDFSKPYGVQE